MVFTRRQFLFSSGIPLAIATAGCIDTNDEGEVPIRLSNNSPYVHTIAIIVSDEDGNTEYHDTIAEISSNTEETLEDKISLPDSVPTEVYVRVLLDTGVSTEFTAVLDTGAEISIGISESGALYNGS
jgi:hypothetical protein